MKCLCESSHARNSRLRPRSRAQENSPFKMAGCLFVHLLCVALPFLCLPGVFSEDCGPLDFDIANLKIATHWWFTQPSCVVNTPHPAGSWPVGNGSTVVSHCLILFSICNPVDKLCSSNSGICETTTNGNYSQLSWPQDLGMVTDAKFTKQGANSFTYEYSSNGGHFKGCTKPLKTSVTFQCHKNKTATKDWIDTAADTTVPPYGRRAAQPVSFNFDNKRDQCELNIVFNSSSSEICRFSPNSGGGSSPATSLSAGSIILILFFPALALYFIAGVLVNSSQGKSGKELIPNHKFWTELPGLIRGGFAFTIAKLTCCNMSTGSESYDRV